MAVGIGSAERVEQAVRSDELAEDLVLLHLGGGALRDGQRSGVKSSQRGLPLTYWR